MNGIYLSINLHSSLRRDITRAFEDIDYEDLKIYIPGCGNSLLAEDLYNVGKSQQTQTVYLYLTFIRLPKECEISLQWTIVV